MTPRYPDFSEKELRKHLSQRLVFWIFARGYHSIELFAHECGTNKGNVSRFVRGAVLPRLPTLLRIVDVLEISLDDLLLDTPLFLAEREKKFKRSPSGVWEIPSFSPRGKRKKKSSP